MIGDLAVRFFLWVSRRTGVVPAVYTGRNDTSPYLTRHFLTKRSADTVGMGETSERNYIGRYLHRFHRGDDDMELHNHPWAWGLSLVLKGGYHEERLTAAGRIVRRTMRPWHLNLLTHKDFHRVELIDGEAWTLFLTGPVRQSWGFCSRDGKTYMPWREFLDGKAKDATKAKAKEAEG